MAHLNATLQEFKGTKAKDFGVKIVFVERSTRAHTLAYVTAVYANTARFAPKRQAVKKVK